MGFLRFRGESQALLELSGGKRKKQQSGRAGLGFLFAGVGMVWITPEA
ncbi:hypothetical protein [Robiginitalea sp.]